MRTSPASSAAARTATTAELGIFEVTTETSSASNVRRIEALTGPAGAELFEERSGRLEEIAAMLRVPEHEVVRAVERLVKQAKQQQKQPAGLDRERADELVASADERGGIRVVVDQVDAPGPKVLALSDAVRQRLATPRSCWARRWTARGIWWRTSPRRRCSRAQSGRRNPDGRPSRGGGGGGRDTMAQAGGVDPGKLPEALAAARSDRER